MNSSGGERADWELADGPVVGQDVPITSEPREEEAPGVPVAPKPEHADDEEGGSEDGLVEPHEAPADDADSASAAKDSN